MDPRKESLKKCFLCQSTDISLSCPNGKLLKESVSNILTALEISPASVFSTVPIGEGLVSTRLVLCNDCDNLISKGIELKKQLRRVRSQIFSAISNSGEDEAATSTGLEDFAVFRELVLGIVSKCFRSLLVNVNAKQPIVISEVRSLREGSASKTLPVPAFKASVKLEVNKDQESGEKTRTKTPEKFVSENLISSEAKGDDGTGIIVKIEAEESNVEYGDDQGDPFIGLNSVESRSNLNEQSCHGTLAEKLAASGRNNDSSQTDVKTTFSSNNKHDENKGKGADFERKRKSIPAKDSKKTCKSGAIREKQVGRVGTVLDDGSVEEFLEHSYSCFNVCENLPGNNGPTSSNISKDLGGSEASIETVSRHSSDEAVSPGEEQVYELYVDESDADLMLFDTTADENSLARASENTIEWSIKDVETVLPKIKCSRKQRLIPRVELDLLMQDGKKGKRRKKRPQQIGEKVKLIKKRAKKNKKVCVEEPERPVSPSAYVFNCKDCPAAFHRAEHLQVHTALHPKFECEQCGKILLSRAARTIHIRMSHLDEPAGCIICGKIMRNKWVLHMHKLMHTRKRKKLESDLVVQPYSPDVNDSKDAEEEG